MIKIKKEIVKKLHKDFDICLNEQQQAAAFHVDGPAIVLAVPGAGKTTTMVVRIHNLINISGVKPENILTMTFSKASAKDMQERYIRLFGLAEARGLVFSTIHSFALSVIRNYERKSNKKFVIIEGNTNNQSRANKISILKELYKLVNNRYITEDEMEQLNNELGLIKNRRLEKIDSSKHKFETPNFTEIFTRYEEYKRANNYIDFDDMLTFAYDILRQNDDMRSYYQKQYNYVLVDEGQDTSLIQHELISLLVMPYNNIFLVADDDQSIYGFRGADPKHLKEFSKNYPHTRKYFIEKNYRSTKEIVSVANAFIKINSDRELKNMVTDNGSGETVSLITVINEEEQLTILRDSIRAKKGKNTTAILYRNNASAMLLVDNLSRGDIAFSLRESRINFLKHWLVTDILAFIHFSIDNSDINAFEKIYYRMEAYLPKTALDKLKRDYKSGNMLAELKTNFNLTVEQKLKAEELQRKFDVLRTLEPQSAINFVCYELNYGSYLKKYCKENNVSENNTDEIVFILKQLAAHTQSNVQFLSRVAELEQIVANASYKGDKSVVLSTIHGVKGLEFDHVIIIDLIEGKLPSGESIKKYEEEKDLSLLSEEARLFYVGITRAKKSLTLIASEYKNGKKVNPSRYYKRVYEIINPGQKLNQEAPDRKEPEDRIRKGDRVRHLIYGEGRVTAVKNDKISVEFAKGMENLFPMSTLGKYLFLTT